MNFITSIKTCFVKYTDFSGRATRSEFWYFCLFSTLLGQCSTVIDAAIVGESYWSYDEYFGPACIIYLLIILIPDLAVTARRLHDINRSGWWMLLIFTGIGVIVLIYWHCRTSEEGSNSYGEDPVKEFGEGVRKDTSKWIQFGLIPIATSLVILGVWFFVPDSSETILDDKVYKGAELPEWHKNTLLEHGIITTDDKILFFESHGVFSILEGGKLVTNNRLVTYSEEEDGSIELSEMLLDNIEKIEVLEDKEDELNTYKVIGNENSDWEYITLIMSNEAGGDQDFISALTDR